MSEKLFHDEMRRKMNEYVHLIYKLTRAFPKDELYGVTSQFRRSSLSIILNYIEGYARIRQKVYKNFLEISYGSLQESKYLLDFSLDEKYIKQLDYNLAKAQVNEIGAMLWTAMKNSE